jgi:hypothetical protein
MWHVCGMLAVRPISFHQSVGLSARHGEDGLLRRAGSGPAVEDVIGEVAGRPKGFGVLFWDFQAEAGLRRDGADLQVISERGSRADVAGHR